MEKNIVEIAQIVDGKVVGDKNITITGFNGIQEAQQGDLTFISASKYISFAQRSKASAIVTSRDITVPHKTLIVTENPSQAFIKIISSFFDEKKYYTQGIHSLACIAKNVKLGKNVSIGPFAIVEDGVKIGNNTVIYAGSYIGHNTVIGDEMTVPRN